jgi:hypothetical protein
MRLKRCHAFEALLCVSPMAFRSLGHSLTRLTLHVNDVSTPKDHPLGPDQPGGVASNHELYHRTDAGTQH